MSAGLERATGSRIANTVTTVSTAHTSIRVPSTSSTTSTATTANQTTGGVPKADIRAKAAMPVMDPMMSIAYALSGGIDLSSGPSGMARVAITAVTMTTARMSTV